MSAAVLDTNVVVSGIGWRGDSRRVLGLLARRAFISVRSPYLTFEWSRVVEELATEPDWPNPNWGQWLNWIKRKSRLVEDPHEKSIVRRDLKDNPILAAAIANQADFLVTQDSHFLALRKPYGAVCLAPREFLRAILSKP